MADRKGLASSRINARELIIQMPEHKWNRVKDVFHEALRRDTAERASFLDEVCAGDDELRIEVESLLDSLREARTFLEMPVIGESAGSQPAWHLENGQKLSHYRIIEPIGSGGMGEVYLAEDERLRRKVALKVLPQEMLQDRNRLMRFQREANAVSALNHPNILTIFEFEKHDGLQYFASEFVQGVTLREKLDSGRMNVAESLETAVQIASALKAAHAAGVIHRDIKPENVMIRHDGFIKVLDFGLAKQLEKIVSGETDTTLTQRFSLPGMIMGTVNYMSPEQARGTGVDARSDIFALGIVLYEMLTGQAPFRGATATDVIAEIIQIDPPPPSSLNNDVSTDLDDAVAKALAKDTGQRYQNVAELQDKLKRILKQLEYAAEFSGRVEAQEESNVRAKSASVKGNGRYVSMLPDLTPLIGRQNELDQLTDLIVNHSSRLVTLTGIGGTGKTRLAQELCRRLASKFTDGYEFVRLAEVHDSHLIVSVISQQLRVQEIVGQPIKQTLLEHVQHKGMLLVLDNFEQVISAAPLVSELLSASDRLVIIVTSRERLNLKAESEFKVQPLPIPTSAELPSFDALARFDSVKLFVERAKQANPEFLLNEINAAQIARICSTLDGLPLAIELAAARARVFSPEVILEKLEARLTFLTGGAIDLPERQRTMRAAVDWSYDLLDNDEKLLFRRLSVFGCQFTADAAEAVVSDNGSNPQNAVVSARQSAEFADTFASLADKSLVYRRFRHGSEVTYCLLEIVREYAESRLEADDDAETIRRRHANWYLNLAEEAEPHLLTTEAPKWVARLDDEYDNIRTALAWSIKAGPQIAARLAAAVRQFWLVRGQLSEGLAWTEEILKQDIDIPAAIKWKLLTVCGNINQFTGDIPRADRFYQEALAEARKTSDQNYLAKSLRGVAALAYMQCDLARARDLVNESISLSKSIGDDFGLAASLARLGDISIVAGDPATARDLTVESLAIFRRVGYTEGVSAKLYNLGAIVFQQGEHEQARQYFEEAYETAVELGEKINTRLIFDGFAALAAEEKDYKRAARLSGVADSLGATVGYTIEPAEQKFRDHYQGRLKRSISTEEFTAEYEAGRIMPLDEARKLAGLSSDRLKDQKPLSDDAQADVSEAVAGYLMPPQRLAKAAMIIVVIGLVAIAAVLIAMWLNSAAR
jgi:predicted ATPase/tRNA A-37 threonylcarbamoyl transferase component Bud32